MLEEKPVRPRRAALWASATALAFVLCACAANDIQPLSNAPSTAPLFPVSPLVVTVVSQGSCLDSPFLLEDWLGRTLASRENLLRSLDEGLSQPDPINRQALENLIVLRTGLSNSTVPDCAIQTHTFLLTLTEDALQLVQGQAAGQSNEEEARASFDERNERLGAQIASLLRYLDELSPRK